MARISPQQLSRFADALEALHAGRNSWRLVCDGRIIHATEVQPLSALALAPTLSDLSSLIEHGTVSVGSPVAFPCLLAPALVDITSRHGRRLSIITPQGEIDIGNSLGEASAQLANWNEMEDAKIATLSASAQASPPNQLPFEGVAIPEPLWQRFDVLARLTYVPASETSRLAGAGAGLLDND